MNLQLLEIWNQNKWNIQVLQIRIVDEPSIILDIPEELLKKNMRENAIWERLEKHWLKWFG